MTKEKLLALTLATFALTAVVSGGATFAVLSDSHVVTAELGAGNVPTQTPTPTPTDGPKTGACEKIGATLHNGSATENPGDISIVLEPLKSGSADQPIDAGNSTTYLVTVEGADRAITGYNLEFALCDPSVATFERFAHAQQDKGYELNTTKTVEGDSVTAGAGVGSSTPIEGPETVLGTITVTGNSSGKTHLGIVNVERESGFANVNVHDKNSKSYNITSTSTVEVKVNEST